MVFSVFSYQQSSSKGFCQAPSRRSSQTHQMWPARREGWYGESSPHDPYFGIMWIIVRSFPIHLFPLSTYIYIYIIYLQNLSIDRSIYLSIYLPYPTLPYSTLNSSEASHGTGPGLWRSPVLAGGASIGSCRPGAAGLDRKQGMVAT